MLTLPVDIIDLLKPFATVFDRRTWIKAQVLLVGSILTPHRRTVTAALRVVGLSGDSNFAKFHHAQCHCNSRERCSRALPGKTSCCKLGDDRRDAEHPTRANSKRCGKTLHYIDHRVDPNRE